MKTINRSIEENILEDGTKYFLFDIDYVDIRTQNYYLLLPHGKYLKKLDKFCYLDDVYDKLSNIIWPLDLEIITLNAEENGLDL